MLEYTVVAASANSCEIHYDVTRLTTLSEYLGKPIDEAALRELLSQVKNMLDVCMSMRLPLKNAVLDINQVYYDSWTRTLRFIYLPLQGIAPDAKKTQAFFEKLAARTRPADEGAARMLAEYRAWLRGGRSFDPVAVSACLGDMCSGSSSEVSVGASSSSPQHVFSQQRGLHPDNLAGRMIRDRPKSAAVSGNAQGPCNAERPGGNGTTVLDDRDALGGNASGRRRPLDGVHGKHAYAPKETGVLNALDWKALSEGECLQLFVEEAFESRSEGESPQPIRASPVPEHPDCTTVLADCVEPPASASVSMPKPDATSKPASELKSAVESEPEPELGSVPAPASPAAKTRFFLTRKKTGERVELAGKRFVVGKSMYSSFQVRDTVTVSRSHALFCCDGDACRMEDDGSKNGTFVNGERLVAHASRCLADGDVVRMSDEDFVFEIERADA